MANRINALALLLFVFFSSSPNISTQCTGNFSNRNSSRSLMLTHIYGGSSPSRVYANATRTQITSDLLQRDAARAKALMDIYNKKVQPAEGQKGGFREPMEPGIDSDVGIYIIQLGFGTLPVEFYLGIDTGSDITWIRCVPCASGQTCNRQPDPFFDPTKSLSYRALACDSPLCEELQNLAGAAVGCSPKGCTYGLRYGDGSTSSGSLSTETLNLGTSTSPIQIFDFVFGCSDRNPGTLGDITGLIGLGRSPLGFPAQTSRIFNSVFAYCLPGIFSSSPAGFIEFGDSADAEAENVYTTPLLARPEFPWLYFVGLREISVNFVAVGVGTAGEYSPGTIIDSGTVITRLPKSTYDDLREVFVEQTRIMSGISPMEYSANSLLDTCYRVGNEYGTTIDFPAVTLRFEGMNDDGIRLPQSNVMYPADEDILCFAFAPQLPSISISVIGSFQQQGFGIVYDVGGSTLGIWAGACS